MKCLLFWFLCSILMLKLSAQQIQTVVPKQAVTVGTAFQIQYIVLDAFSVEVEDKPSFKNFDLVSGPHIYKGKTTVNGTPKSIENIVYTLVPQTIGEHKIKGIEVKVGATKMKAGDATVVVTAQAGRSANPAKGNSNVSLYSTSRTNLEKIIDDNLFVTATVDKKHCYEGEPVVATFRLYSRLQSTSEVIKPPALYGFAAVDILNISEANHTVETINGKVFNTSILRKVQLYPIQSGTLAIDPMVVNNILEFKDDAHPEGKVLLEKEITTPKINIMVKPLPLKRPDSFEGAVGNFSLQAKLEKTQIATNEQGRLLVTIAGKGNFVQFDRPQITWPEGFEVFELPVEEKLNRTKVPTEGYRTFVFGFSSHTVGDVVIPPFPFSFFDPVKKQFKTVATDSLKFTIVAAAAKKSQETNPAGEHQGWWPLLAALAVLLSVILFFVFRGKKKQQQIKEAEAPDIIASINDLLIDSMNDKEMANRVQQLIYELLKNKYGTARLEAVKTKMPLQQFENLNRLMNDCQLISYTAMETEGRKTELKEKAIGVAKELQ